MRRVTSTRAFVAVVLILTLSLSVGLLFGAQGVSLKLLAPAPQAKVTGLITVSADLRGSKPGTYAILVVDRDRPGSTNSFPCSFELDTRELADGPHRILVEAYDDSGLLAASKPVTIIVRNRPAAVTTVKAPAPAALARRPAGKKIVIIAPAKTVAGVSGAAPRTADAAEGAPTPAAAAPVQVGGPTPEPTRTTATAPQAPRDRDAAEGPARAAASVDARTAQPPVRAAAAPSHTVFLNGRAVKFDVVPVMRGGRLHGGFRALFAKAGGKVTWRDDLRTARSVSPTLTVEVPSGSRIARVNGQGVDMGSPAQLAGGRLIVPVRFFADTTGATVAWNSRTGIAHLSIVPQAIAARPE